MGKILLPLRLGGRPHGGVDPSVGQGPEPISLSPADCKGLVRALRRGGGRWPEHCRCHHRRQAARPVILPRASVVVQASTACSLWMQAEACTTISLLEVLGCLEVVFAAGDPGQVLEERDVLRVV